MGRGPGFIPPGRGNWASRLNAAAARAFKGAQKVTKQARDLRAQTHKISHYVRDVYRYLRAAPNSKAAVKKLHNILQNNPGLVDKNPALARRIMTVVKRFGVGNTRQKQDPIQDFFNPKSIKAERRKLAKANQAMQKSMQQVSKEKEKTWKLQQKALSQYAKRRKSPSYKKKLIQTCANHFRRDKNMWRDYAAKSAQSSGQGSFNINNQAATAYLEGLSSSQTTFLNAQLDAVKSAVENFRRRARQELVAAGNPNPSSSEVNAHMIRKNKAQLTRLADLADFIRGEIDAIPQLIADVRTQII